MSSYQAPKPGSSIIIVGGGCFGLSTALALSRDKSKNYQITVYDREAIPVRDAASNDISKVVRMDYGDSRLYTDLAIDSIDIWNQWNKERAEENKHPVFHNTGILIFSGTNELTNIEVNSIKHIKNAGHADWIEELTPGEIKQRYPYLGSAVNNGFSAAYYNKVGGWCNSSEGIKHVYNKCIENGVQFVLGENEGTFTELVKDPENHRSIIGISTKDGKVHKADRVVMTVGSWLPSLLDMKQQIIATGHVLIHFRPTETIKRLLRDLPTWFGDFHRAGFYGFPINSDGVMKIGLHSSGYLNPRKSDGVSVPRTHSTHEGDTIPLQAVADCRQYLQKFLPVLDGLDITYSRVCWYADSIDGDFIVAPHPDYDNLVFASGDSGHAMKFLPAIGTRIAQVIENEDNEYTRSWAWREPEPRPGFYERPLLVDEEQTMRMATPADLKSNTMKTE